MNALLKRELSALERMTVNELREKHRLLFGEENRSRHKDFLRKRIAWRLQALDEGGLSERALQRAKELANDPDPGRSCGFFAHCALAFERSLGNPL